MKHRILVILGATASGKSEYALAAAMERDAEIINCDSMQVYRDLPIGTAQPDAAMLAEIPHHLFGFLPLSAPWDVNRFLQAAKEKIAEIQSRGKNVIIAGGTGLYAKSLVYGHHPLPADPAVFAHFQKTLETEGVAALKDFLLSKIEEVSEVPQDVLLNPRRLLRACEVIQLTGEPPWRLHQSTPKPAPEFEQQILMPNWEALKDKIRIRTGKMLQSGWIEECRGALQNGLMQSPTARQALGYREIAAYLDGTGARTMPELEELLVFATIRYARRQMTWFRHQHPGAEFINQK